MSLPFTIDQFLDVFRRYNESIWPGQWVLNLLAVVADQFRRTSPRVEALSSKR